MAVYVYKATRGHVGLLGGTVVADTPRQARELLRAQGLVIQQITSLATRGDGAGPGLRLGGLDGSHWWRSRASFQSQVPGLIRDLATLLAVGVPLVEALDTLVQQHSGSKLAWGRRRFGALVLQLRERVAAGASLAEAMAEQPQVFNELCIHIVEVGETSGNLEPALERLAEYQEKAVTFRNKITAALIYPAMVLATAIGVSVFLMTFVVPRILTALVEMNRPLPWATRLVKLASDTLVHGWWVILPGLLLLVMGWMALLQTPRFRRRWHRFQWRLPVLGPIGQQQAIGRVATVVATLLKSGIAFEQAITIARRSTTNLVLQDALRACAEAVQAGKDIAPALASTQVFPPTVLQVFAVGQHSGRLEEMLERLAGDYDKHVAVATQRLTALLEPLLILLLAVMVGFIAFATIMPILEAGNVF